MSEHAIRAEMLGRVIENVRHDVDQAGGVDRLTLTLRLPHHRSYQRRELLDVVIEGRRDRGLVLRDPAPERNRTAAS